MLGPSRVFINGNRNGYTPEQCGKTMTVEELIEFLQNFDEKAHIFLRHNEGYTYGSINERDFTTNENYEDNEEWEV